MNVLVTNRSKLLRFFNDFHFEKGMTSAQSRCIFHYVLCKVVNHAILTWEYILLQRMRTLRPTKLRLLEKLRHSNLPLHLHLLKDVRFPASGNRCNTYLISIVYIFLHSLFGHSCLNWKEFPTFMLFILTFCPNWITESPFVLQCWSLKITNIYTCSPHVFL